MTPSAIIAQATTDGVSIALAASGNIKASGARAVVDKWLPVIRANKLAIIAELKEQLLARPMRVTPPDTAEWGMDHWHVYFSDRTAPNGLLVSAQLNAFNCCLSEWLDQNPIQSEPGRCLYCGAADSIDPLVPFGTMPPGYAWLHVGCWRNWFAERRAQAREALAALGITAPSGAEGGRDGYH